MIRIAPAAVGFFALSSLVLTSLLVGCGKKPPATDASGAQLNDYTSMRAKVINRIKNGTLAADGAGVVQLPPDLEGAAADGRVLVANDPKAGLLVLFKVMPSGPNEIMALLYTERPLPPPPSEISFGPLSLKIRRRIDEHWSEISYRA